MPIIENKSTELTDFELEKCGFDTDTPCHGIVAVQGFQCGNASDASLEVQEMARDSYKLTGGRVHKDSVTGETLCPKRILPNSRIHSENDAA